MRSNQGSAKGGSKLAMRELDRGSVAGKGVGADRARTRTRPMRVGRSLAARNMHRNDPLFRSVNERIRPLQRAFAAGTIGV